VDRPGPVAYDAEVRLHAAHLSGNGVWFDSRAWIVTAGRHRTGLLD